MGLLTWTAGVSKPETLACFLLKQLIQIEENCWKILPQDVEIFGESLCWWCCVFNSVTVEIVWMVHSIHMNEIILSSVRFSASNSYHNLCAVSIIHKSKPSAHVCQFCFDFFYFRYFTFLTTFFAIEWSYFQHPWRFHTRIFIFSNLTSFLWSCW